MHPLYEKADKVYHDVISAATEVRKIIGPGLLESVYEDCLEHELTLRGHTVKRQQYVDIKYKGVTFTHKLKADLIVDDCFIIELKAIEGDIRYEHRIQCLSYLKAFNYPLGVVLNFGVTENAVWFYRVILKGAAPDEETKLPF